MLCGGKSLDLNWLSAAGMNNTRQRLGDTSCVVVISNNMRPGTSESSSRPKILEYFCSVSDGWCGDKVTNHVDEPGHLCAFAEYEMIN